MCGIVGYTGKQQATPILLDGLSKLEYRGYDSSGICIFDVKDLKVEKAKGRLQNLIDKVQNSEKITGTTGIGHTRWATHGAPSDINAHPQLSNSGKIALVHNGIIDNEGQLRQWLEKKGIKFQSETDTEVLANLIGVFYEEGNDFPEAVRLATAQIEGSFALGILCEDDPGTIIAVKKDSPLVFGFGQGENFMASDVPVLLKYTRDIAYLDDGEMVVFNASVVKFYNALGDEIEKAPERINWELSVAERGGYAHFMLKEIMEQPKALRDTISPRLRSGEVVFERLGLSGKQLQSIKKIYMVACGSAYYVAVHAKYIMEKNCRIPTEAVMASEFRYAEPVIDANDLVIMISQSGETADTLAALKEAKRRGTNTLAIVNVVGSAMSKLADHVIYTWAGPEIAVATTKAFSAQLAVVYLLTLHMAKQLGTVSDQEYSALTRELELLPDAVAKVLSDQTMQKCRHLAEYYHKHYSAFYIGRNIDSAVCLEGSLKVKEVAYLHAEAYPAGELKHGPISLIENGTLVVAVNTVMPLFDKTMANVKEVKARGAEVLCIVPEGMQEQTLAVADSCITVPQTHPMLQPSLSLIPLQLFAYYMALCRGCDVDKPKNLAKSVTVE